MPQWGSGLQERENPGGESRGFWGTIDFGGTSIVD
jgi:hypothetical protein